MKTKCWLNDNELYNVDTAREWNIRKLGAFTEDASKLRKHLTEDTNLLRQWGDTLIDMEKNGFKINGKCLDLGGGSGWATAILSARSDVHLVHLIDISKIRIERMLPVAIKVFGGNPEKIVPVIGDFCNIRLPDSSVDCVVMNQSIHHAKFPIKVLSECNRVLKKEGLLIVIGEEPVTERYYYIKFIYRILRSIIKRSDNKDMRFRTLFPPSKLGDRHWRKRHYVEMFNLTGFDEMIYFSPGYQHKNLSPISKLLGERFYGNFYGKKYRDVGKGLFEIEKIDKIVKASKFLSEIYNDSEQE